MVDMKKSKIEIAKHILENCFWGNTTMTPDFIVNNINQNKQLAQQIFSAIFQNSPTMLEDLNIIDDQEMIKEFIISQNQRLGHFKRDFLETRLDELIKYYGVKNAGKRREIRTVV